ncbi:MAG: transcriptional repressor [Deltaproteobacteria bacterium]|nr:transcriptional repressor [Deltaproteobacteria bacterium]
MIKTEIIFSNLKRNGHRLTKTRKAIVSALLTSECPLSAFDLKARLLDGDVEVNKTTVYRELAFLVKHNVIHEIQFGDGKTRYRVCPDGHHHHAICVKCSKVDEIIMENDLAAHEKKLDKLINFKVLHHTLEFFGLCKACNNAELKKRAAR